MSSISPSIPGRRAADESQEIVDCRPGGANPKSRNTRVLRHNSPLLEFKHPFAPSSCFDIMAAMQTELTEQAKKLSISDRILLVEEIWDTIAEENEAFELTDAQRTELDRRLELARTNPGQGRTWDEIKAEFTKSR
jgi:putative addiction module component (TIGR02574 family)